MEDPRSKEGDGRNGPTGQEGSPGAEEKGRVEIPVRDRRFWAGGEADDSHRKARPEPQMKEELPMTEGFTLKRRVNFVEVDLAGVMHFSNYYRLMEEAESGFWRSLGMGLLTGDGSRGLNWPRVSTSCRYFAPIRFDDELELKLRVAGVGEKCVRYEVDFLHAGRRVAHGKMTVICCAAGLRDGSFESIPIPDAVRSRLTAC